MQASPPQNEYEPIDPPWTWKNEIRYFFSEGLWKHTIWYGIKEHFRRKIRGYSDSEWYNFNTETAKYIIPRLKHLRNNLHAWPAGKDVQTPEDWEKILDEMIWTFEFINSDDFDYVKDKSQWDRMQEGLNLFAKYYVDLWD
jgi:hypothetical protein